MGRTPEVSFLVAFRDSDGTRTRLWSFIRERTERLFPEAEVVIGDDGGTDPFHKTRALNDAASRARADVLVVWDSDTWLDPEQVRFGVDAVANGRWCKPWATKLKLNRAATELVLSLGRSWDGTIDHKPFGPPENVNWYWGGPPIVLSREMWDAVGGHDERFRGWSSEDGAFVQSLNVIVGRPVKGKGQALHLCHDRIGKSGNDLWLGQDSAAENKRLGARYAHARTANAMRQLIAERELVDVG